MRLAEGKSMWAVRLNLGLKKHCDPVTTTWRTRANPF